MQESELAQFSMLLKLGYSIPDCAKELGRHKSTLYELLTTNQVPYNSPKYEYFWGKSGDASCIRRIGKKAVRFDPHTIQLKRSRRKSVASIRYCRIENTSDLALFIERKIRKRWSPKQISGRWTRDTGEQLSKDTIYRYIYSTHPEWIKKYFRRKGRKYIHHKKREAMKLLDRRSIELRPQEVETRQVFGHWEWDTVMGAQGSTACFLTIVERKTGLLIARKLPDRKSESVYESFLKFSHKKKSLMKTMTFDNGVEFALHSLIEYETKAPVYFAHPYRSSERGTNENTNGLLRQYFPKKTNLSDITEKQLQQAVREINSRPRERLSFKSPYEAVKEELLKSRKWD